LKKIISFKKKTAIIEINNSSRGIFLLHLIFKEFEPWIFIKGLKKLFKSDFPKEIFEQSYLPKKWSSKVEEKIKSVVR